MNTPICDFVKKYALSDISRLHMPGHKGRGFLGCEAFDITEVAGADDLSAPQGIIRESEDNATSLFGSKKTFYSAGGSSQCIKAMLYLALLFRPANTEPVILAGRNAHKAFIHACALLDIEPVWLRSHEEDHLCACPITAASLEAALNAMERTPMAVYVTSPDYLGGTLDIASLSAVCQKHHLPLLVDNAHGAYLHFLQPAQHPLDLGATMCCDSAHKTLPVLTGGSYLHIAKKATEAYETQASQALSLFGSSSPSYLILQSLDSCNALLAGSWPQRLWECVQQVAKLKQQLTQQGLHIRPGESMKLVIDAAATGNDGRLLANRLRQQQVEPEYADEDTLVMMFSPDVDSSSYKRILGAFADFEAKKSRCPLTCPEPGKQLLTPRQAMLSPREIIATTSAIGRICAGTAVSCPPAIPIVVLGEEITANGAALMEKLGINKIPVCIR